MLNKNFQEDFDSFQSDLLLKTAQNQSSLAKQNVQSTSNGLCV